MTSRDKKVLIGFTVLALLVGYWFLVLKPKRAELAKVKQSVTKEERQLENAKQRLASYQVARQTYAADFRTVVHIGEAVPEDDAIPSLLVQLDALTGGSTDFSELGVEQYPVPLLAPSFGQESPPGGAAESSTPKTASEKGPTAADKGSGEAVPLGLQPVRVRLQFQGDFFKIDRLFAAVDKLVRASADKIDVAGRLVFVEGFKLKQGREGFPKVAANVGVFVFSLPDGQSVKAGATVQSPPSVQSVADQKERSDSEPAGAQ